MQIDLKRVGELVTLFANGSPEELAQFCQLVGINVDQKTLFVQGPAGPMGAPGPMGPAGMTGPAGPAGPMGPVKATPISIHHAA